ncbi:hypothetical protein [Pyxidicoccus sp. MSG2]|uniref:hypothetical protein n=1 Tax=Pyxidicoccus sp. MSG2 TaxID=2996790 RepID=UPI00226EC67D|nr:hypothetical protein [Pyxidicoccus sp. MSG2]MCY1015724.1 hypothetical protein [Pyxidicoccus sp. MSG2]
MSESTRNRPPQGQVAYDDVDDLIRTATRMMQKDAAPETLTTDDLKRIGEELDIPGRYIDQAMAALAQRHQEQEQARREEEAAAKARRERLGRRLRLGAIVAASLAGVAGLSGLSMRNGLNTTLQEVTRQRAQVRNVLERRVEVEKRYTTAIPGPERDAQISGADNRVAVEKRRYDGLATQYNAAASAFPQSWVVGLTGLPSSVPLSTDVGTW